MQYNNISDELSIDLLTHDFNSRSFLMFLRRQNERHREVITSQRNRQYYSFDHSRGFDRLIHFPCSNSAISSHLISEDGRTMTDNLSQQLLDDNLSLVRRHWRRSKMTLTNKMEQIQSDLHSRTSTSLKKEMNDCQQALFNWISKNRLR